MFNGKIFVIEGPDGSGKSTMCHNISKKLLDKNIFNEVIPLPNKFSFGYTKLREMLTNKKIPTDIVQSIMIANMQEAFDKEIKARLEADVIVILDRWLISTIIYNILNNGKLVDDMAVDGELMLQRISTSFCNLYNYPNKIFYLNTPKSLVLEHARSRNSNEVNDQENTVKQVYNLYHDFYTAIKHGGKFPFGSKKYKLTESNVVEDTSRHILISSEEPNEVDMYNEMENKILQEIYSSIGYEE